jgi:hypothetical protein
VKNGATPHSDSVEAPRASRVSLSTGAHLSWRSRLLAALLTMCAAAPVDAQDRLFTPGEDKWPIDPGIVPRPAARALLTTVPITIDGRLDEAAWQEAEPITNFVQSGPDTGYPATEQTVVRILYDAGNLYIGAFCYDSDPDRITITSMVRDFPTSDNDLLAIAIDTYLDRRNAFIFAVNPRGAIADAQAFNDARITDWGWDGVVHVRTVVVDSGWTMEMAIPWTSLRFADAELQDWGINFLRRIRRKSEDSYWAPLVRHERLQIMSRAGLLKGLDGLRQRHNLTVKPYIFGGQTGGTLHENASNLSIGGDLKYGLTPGLTLDLSLRTDFSQVEVDQEQINLTRFPLFFPERREFFIENGGVFTFGDHSQRNYRVGASLQDFTLFHSRRIGLNAERQPVPLDAGGRISGRLGDFEIGLLTVRTARTQAEHPPENLGVFRVRRNLWGGSDVGMMITNRQRSGFDDNGHTYNRTVGLDGNFRLLDHMIVHTYYAASMEPGTTGDRSTFRASAAWRDRFWNISALARQVGDDFNPGMGFVRRQGIRHYYATVGAHPRPQLEPILEVNPYVSMSYITDLNSTVETRETCFGLDVALRQGGRISVEYDRRWEKLSDPFRIYDVVEVPAGTYEFDAVSLGVRSDRGRPLSGRIQVGRGEFFHGERTTVTAGAFWRANHHLTMDVFLEHNEVTVPDESLTVGLAGVRARYSLSTRLFASAFLQYNAGGDELISNLRFNFVHAPLSDFYIVYMERRGTEGVVTDRSLALKMTRLVAF